MSQKGKPSTQVTKKTTSSAPAVTTASPIVHSVALESSGQVADEKVLVINNIGNSD